MKRTPRWRDVAVWLGLLSGRMLVVPPFVVPRDAIFQDQMAGLRFALRRCFINHYCGPFHVVAVRDVPSGERPSKEG